MNADPESQSLIAQFILLIVLTLLNAFFAAAEIAVVSLNKNRIEQKAASGDKKAIRLSKVLKDSSSFLSTIQVGITLVNIFSGASLAESLSAKLSPVLGGTTVSYQISRVIVLIFLTYVSIVFGELYPKRIALNKSEEVANFAVGPILFVGKIARPFVWLLSASTDLLSRITPMKFDDNDSKYTREEMRYMLENDSVLDSDELEMVQGVFSLDTKRAKEIMVPRPDCFMIDITNDAEKNIELVLNESFSRIPVYDEDKDKIVGILHIKNLLKAAHENGFDKVCIKDVMAEPLFVPETIFIDDLMVELQHTQNQMAILLDEYGGVVGLATLEDLLEEIVGEIDDESDEASLEYTKIADRTYLVQGKMTIEDFNEQFETELLMDDVDTIAGYLITALGAIPDKGQNYYVEESKLTLYAEELDGARVSVVKVVFDEALIEDEDVTKESEEVSSHKEK